MKVIKIVEDVDAEIKIVETTEPGVVEKIEDSKDEQKDN
jgi:hypothetical protein